MKIEPGPRKGAVSVPASKSHEHRLLIANFLAGSRSRLKDAEGDNADIAATKRCLRELARGETEVLLDCGESGSTLRFLAPVAAALGKRATFIRSGRLAERPFKEYTALKPGVHTLAGDISSQFVTGLLFALPLLDGDSEVRFLTPLESRGYVDMTLEVIRKAGVEIGESSDGFSVRGGQRFSEQAHEAERDWSGAAFWYAMNALGSEIEIGPMPLSSRQPDRAIAEFTRGKLPERIDVSQFPDIFPVLSVVAAGTAQRTVFTGIKRLRLKECDRVAAMADVLARFGVAVEKDEERFAVEGTSGAFRGGEFSAWGDHRIAMSVAVGATRADSPVELDDPTCAAKSYPGFFSQFTPLAKSSGYLV